MVEPILQKRSQRRFNVPVIGHFANKSIRFNSILQAELITGISYTLIYEACLGKIYKARNVYWEFENGAHYIHYKAFYIRIRQKLEGTGHVSIGQAHAHGLLEIDGKAK